MAYPRIDDDRRLGKNSTHVGTFPCAEDASVLELILLEGWCLMKDTQEQHYRVVRQWFFLDRHGNWSNLLVDAEVVAMILKFCCVSFLFVCLFVCLLFNLLLP